MSITSDSPFAYSAPAPASTASSPPAALLETHFADSPLLPRFVQLADLLYSRTVAKEVRRQLEQLKGELRDEYKAKARVVKADWMARVVPGGDERAEVGDGEAVEEQLERATLDGEQDLADAPEAPPLAPTILSDADEAAAMSLRVDAQVEATIQEQLKEANERVSASVGKTVAMEMELWLGAAVLDAFDQAAGDEQGAATFVQAALEDRLLDEDIPLPPSV
ncbi:hypothetical protein JCM10207_003676 [Rhodosporidiobolus poonsookiae]